MIIFILQYKKKSTRLKKKSSYSLVGGASVGGGGGVFARGGVPEKKQTNKQTELRFYSFSCLHGTLSIPTGCRIETGWF